MARDLIRTLEMSKHRAKLLQVIPLSNITGRAAEMTALEEATSIIRQFEEFLASKDDVGLKEFHAKKSAEMQLRKAVGLSSARPASD